MTEQQKRLIELGKRLHKLNPPSEQIRRYKKAHPESKGHPICVRYDGWAQIIAGTGDRQNIADAINLAARVIGELETEAELSAAK